MRSALGLARLPGFRSPESAMTDPQQSSASGALAVSLELVRAILAPSVLTFINV